MIEKINTKNVSGGAPGDIYPGAIIVRRYPETHDGKKIGILSSPKVEENAIPLYYVYPRGSYVEPEANRHGYCDNFYCQTDSEQKARQVLNLLHQHGNKSLVLDFTGRQQR